MRTGIRFIGLLLAPCILMLAQHSSGGEHASGGGGHASSGAVHAGAGASHAAVFGGSAIAPPRPTSSFGLSPPTIGLSPSSIGLSPQSFGSPARAVYPSFSRQYGSGSPYYSRYGRRGNRFLPYTFIGAPYFPFDYGAGAYDYDEDAGEPPPPAPAEVSPAEAQLSNQVAQLSAQLNDLQNQIGQSGSPPNSNPPPSAPQSEELTPPPPPVTVVLNSGKSLTVQNYAVVGDTFWDFSSQPAKRIALSQINVPASAQASEAAGAEFPKIGK